MIELAAAVRPGRIVPLDGLRGVAIALVLVFHIFVRWPDFVPWLTDLEGVPFVEHSSIGVQLFFLVSGYVIFMTLDNCTSLQEFLLRRWLRLFPAVLVATVLLYATSGWLPDRPSGQPWFGDIFPGLLFLQPGVFNTLFGHEFRPLEGGLWSLFVEVKFYLVFGALYFADRRRAAIWLTVLFGLAVFARALFEIAPDLPGRTAASLVLLNGLALHHFGWFASGAWAYRYMRTRRSRDLACSAALMPFNLYMLFTSYLDNLDGLLLAAIVYGLFISALFGPRAQRLLSAAPLVFLGFISYPLYLINENALVAFTIATRSWLPFIPERLTFVPGLLVVGLIAWLIAAFLEPRLKAAFLAGLRRIGSVVRRALAHP